MMPPRVRQIIEKVAARTGVSVRELLGERTTRRVAFARQRAMFAIRHGVKINGQMPTSPQIGAWLGGRDHTTILHGLRRHEERRAA